MLRNLRSALFILLVSIMSLLIGSLTIVAVIQTPSANAVRVGIMDSGVPFLESQSVIKKSFVTLENGYPVEESVYDLYGHGSLVYESVLDSEYSSVPLKIYSAKFVNSNGDVSEDGFINALLWLHENEVKIVIMSFEIELTYEMEILMHSMYLDGMIFVASSGNRGWRGEYHGGMLQYPSALNFTFGIGALDGRGEVASYSSFAMSPEGYMVVDFVEPGILRSKNLGVKFGTSFATPRFAAKIAYLISKAGLNDIGFMELRSYLISSTDGVYDMRSGYGVLDVDVVLSSVLDTLPFTENVPVREFNYSRFDTDFPLNILYPGQKEIPFSYYDTSEGLIRTSFDGFSYYPGVDIPSESFLYNLSYDGSPMFEYGKYYHSIHDLEFRFGRVDFLPFDGVNYSYYFIPHFKSSGISDLISLLYRSNVTVIITAEDVTSVSSLNGTVYSPYALKTEVSLGGVRGLKYSGLMFVDAGSNTTRMIMPSSSYESEVYAGYIQQVNFSKLVVVGGADVFSDDSYVLNNGLDMFKLLMSELMFDD